MSRNRTGFPGPSSVILLFSLTYLCFSYLEKSDGKGNIYRSSPGPLQDLLSERVIDPQGTEEGPFVCLTITVIRDRRNWKMGVLLSLIMMHFGYRLSTWKNSVIPRHIVPSENTSPRWQTFFLT